MAANLGSLPIRGVSGDLQDKGLERMTIKIEHAAHVAHYKPMTGQGLLVLPRPEGDVPCPVGVADTLHGADWNAMVRHLATLGIEPQEDDECPYGTPQRVGVTLDGRTVLALYGPSITTEPTAEELTEEYAELLDLAGVRCEPPHLNG